MDTKEILRTAAPYWPLFVFVTLSLLADGRNGVSQERASYIKKALSYQGAR